MPRHSVSCGTTRRITVDLTNQRNRRFQFHERRQIFIRTHNVTFSVAMRVYEVRPRKDHRGVDLISDGLPFGCLWYGEREAIANAIGYAKFFSRSHDAVIRVYDDAGNVIETHEHKGDFREAKYQGPRYCCAITKVEAGCGA